MEQIIGEYTFADYLLANRCHLKNDRYLKKYFIICIIIVLFIGLKICFFYWDTIDLFALCFFLILITYPYIFLPSKTKNLFKKQKQLHGQTTISFDDNSIIDTTAQQETKLWWAYKYVMCKNMLLIYNTPGTFIMIPRRFCKSEEQFKRITDVAKKLSEK